MSVQEIKEVLDDKQDELEDCKESLELAYFKIQNLTTDLDRAE